MTKRKLTTRDIINLSVVVVFFAAMIFVSIKYSSHFIVDGDLYKSAQKLSDLVEDSGLAAPIMIGIGALQAVVAFIPGAVTQFANGFIFGVFKGTLVSHAGVLIGSIIAFYFARIFGKPLVSLFVPEKVFTKFYAMFDNPKSTIIIALLFLVPGLPKDFFPYIAGASPIGALKFCTLSVLGRTPGIITSAYMGTTVDGGNYTLLIIVVVLTMIPLIALYVFRNKIFKFDK